MAKSQLTSRALVDLLQELGGFWRDYKAQFPRRKGGRNCPRSHCRVVARPCSFPALSHRVGDTLRSGRLGGLLHAVCYSLEAGSTCQAVWACWHDQALPSTPQIPTQRWFHRSHHRDPSAGPLATVVTVGRGAVLGWAPSQRHVLRLGDSLSSQQVRDRVTLGSPSPEQPGQLLLSGRPCLEASALTSVKRPPWR